MTGKKLLIIAGVILFLIGGWYSWQKYEEVSTNKVLSFAEAEDILERNGARRSHINGLQLVLEVFRLENGNYPTTDTFPQEAITQTKSHIPPDPGNGPCKDYQWISNEGRPDAYCAYACLEKVTFEFEGEIQTEEGYIVAKPDQPAQISKTAPTTIECEITN